MSTLDKSHVKVFGAVLYCMLWWFRVVLYRDNSTVYRTFVGWCCAENMLCMGQCWWIHSYTCCCHLTAPSLVIVTAITLSAVGFIIEWMGIVYPAHPEPTSSCKVAVLCCGRCVLSFGGSCYPCSVRVCVFGTWVLGDDCVMSWHPNSAHPNSLFPLHPTLLTTLTTHPIYTNSLPYFLHHLTTQHKQANKACK
jgi:hypothetical protein